MAYFPRTEILQVAMKLNLQKKNKAQKNKKVYGSVIKKTEKTLPGMGLPY